MLGAQAFSALSAQYRSCREEDQHQRQAEGGEQGLQRDDAGHQVAVAAELALPPRVTAVFGLCVGTPDPQVPTAVKPRPAQSVVLHHEHYALPPQQAGLARYDQAMAAFYESQQMKVRLSLSARPDYVAEQGAIYLRDLELISVKTEPADVGAALTPLLPTFNQSLSLFLSQTPVYRLDGSRKNEARIKEKVEALKVEPGRLVIPFKLM